MLWLDVAIQTALEADTLVSTVGSGSTTTSVQLGSGEAASWAIGDVTLHSGTGASAANDGDIRTVDAVDTSADTIGVDPALGAAPISGDTVKGGVVEWAVANGIEAREPRVDAPVDDLIDADAIRVAVLHGKATDGNVTFAATEQRHEVHVIGRDPAYVDGCTNRIRRRFYRRPDRLTSDVGVITELAVRPTEPRVDRSDEMHEEMVPLVIEATESAGA